MKIPEVRILAGVTEIFFTYLQLCFNLTITFAIIVLLTQLFFFLPQVFINMNRIFILKFYLVGL